tara:strand:+ start:339 stop:473 length:135 start_codon:yes stop_codon:yes gene_type:complete
MILIIKKATAKTEATIPAFFSRFHIIRYINYSIKKSNNETKINL